MVTTLATIATRALASPHRYCVLCLWPTWSAFGHAPEESGCGSCQEPPLVPGLARIVANYHTYIEATIVGHYRAPARAGRLGALRQCAAGMIPHVVVSRPVLIDARRSVGPRPDADGCAASRPSSAWGPLRDSRRRHV